MAVDLNRGTCHVIVCTFTLWLFLLLTDYLTMGEDFNYNKYSKFFLKYSKKQNFVIYC